MTTTTTPTTTQTTTRARAVDEARRLAPLVADRALEGEADRCVAVDVVDELRSAGLLTCYLPAALGGLELAPLETFDVIETIAAADGSTGWTTFILNSTYFVSWLDPDVARTMLAGEPGGGMASSFGPFGRATTRPDGDLVLDGRWPFNSGSPHASWFANGAMVQGRDGEPRWRFVFFRSTDCEILDTWRVAGLRATASHDVVVQDLRVPAAMTANPIFEPARHDTPFLRWPFFAQLGTLFAGFPLGVARRALDEFVTVAQTKARGGNTTLATESHVAIAVARAEARLRAARAFVVDSIGEAWARSLAGGALTFDDRVAIRLANANAIDTAVEVVDTVFHLAGGAALYDTNPLQRCWRDVHAGAQHLYHSANHRTLLGTAVLGQPVADDFVI
jgi:alkylation response protein AidB-like acyl-CoA dehydrogenase